MLAMTPGIPMHIGIDDFSVVRKGNAIIEHPQGRAEANLHCAQGQLILGGMRSKLHRKSPYKMGWAMTKDGDQWELFAKIGTERPIHDEDLEGEGPSNR